MQNQGAEHHARGTEEGAAGPAGVRTEVKVASRRRYSQSGPQRRSKGMSGPHLSLRLAQVQGLGREPVWVSGLQRRPLLETGSGRFESSLC